jgi:CubicO group peptidase (beta-lactamase class C family)
MTLTRALVDDVAGWADDWLQHRQRTLRIPGLQFAIAHEGEIIRSGAHGHADVSTGAALGEDHLFRIASHSKTFTATAILQLTEEPDPPIRLDDPLRRHLSWLVDSEVGRQVADLTIGDLLGHGGGMTRDGRNGDHWQLRRPFPDEPVLRELVADTPSPYAGNERFHYSNIAYSLLGLAIEAVTGRSYREHLRAAVIEPLALTDTDPDYRADAPGLYAAGHTNEADGRERLPIEHVPTNAMAAATGFTSTARDLATYFGAHCFGDVRLLGDPVKRRMQRPQWTQREGEHYGLGLQLLDLSPGGRRLVGHAGGYPGHITQTWCDPNEAVVVSVLCNAIDAPASDLATGIFRLLDHAEGTDASVPPHADGTDPTAFSGRFESLWAAVDTVALDGRLFFIPLTASNPVDVLGELSIEDHETARLVRARDGYTSEGELFVFERDSGGRLERIRGTSGVTYRTPRAYEAEFLSGTSVRPVD